MGKKYAVLGAVVGGLLLASCSSGTDDADSGSRADAASGDTPPAATITGFNTPQVVAASSDGELLYVAQNDGTISLVATPKNTPAGSWASGVTNPLGIALSPDGKSLYLSNRTGNTVVQKDAVTGAATGSWSTGSGSNPTGIALSPDGETIYVPQNASAGIGAHKLTVRKAATGGLLQTWELPAGSRPRAAAVSPDGDTTYVSFEGSNSISVRAAKDGSEIASWPLASTGFSTPGYLALSKKGDLLYVGTVSPSGVLVLNTKDGSVAGKWTTGFSSAFGVAAANCGQTIFVANATNPGTVSAVEQPNQCESVPGVPRNVKATWSSKEKYIEVEWTPPADTGGSPITRYQAVATDKDVKTKITHTCEADGQELSCQMPGVKGGPKFEVRVTAYNANGTGPASDPVDVKQDKE